MNNEGITNELRERALDGVTVLEYCSMISGPYCTKIMADLGAEVIKIESPAGGDAARRMPPFPGDKSHPEKSGLFFYLNTNKQGITLDLETLEGKEIFLELVKTADILVEDSPPGHMDQSKGVKSKGVKSTLDSWISKSIQLSALRELL